MSFGICGIVTGIFGIGIISAIFRLHMTNAQILAVGSIAGATAGVALGFAVNYLFLKTMRFVSNKYQAVKQAINRRIQLTSLG